jgi:dTMP kinase
MKGKLIVFEGIDGSGKSYTANLLAEKLRSLGKKVLLTCQPSKDTQLQQTIRSMVLNNKLDNFTRLCLFTADRRVHCEQIINPALENGYIVICDRWYYSTLVYQDTIDIDLNIQLQKEACLGIKPNVVFFLNTPLDIVNERLKSKANKDQIEEALVTNTIRERYKYVFHKLKSEENHWIKPKTIYVETHFTDLKDNEIIEFLFSFIGFSL